MKKFTLVLLALLIGLVSFSQKINGQWRGYFDSNGDIVLNSGNNTEYVLELEISGTKVTGFSYSYFQGRRYYVICKLDGIYDKAEKSIKVTETERVKGNTPPDFSDCLQVHYLSYSKDSSIEKLSGTWKTAPGQRPGCGEGTTTLTRRTLSNDLASYNKAKNTPSAVTKNTVKKPSAVAGKKPTPPATAKKISPAKPKSPVVKNEIKRNPENTAKLPPPIAKADPEKNDLPTIPDTKKPQATEIKPLQGFEKRNNELLKTIQIESETFTVDLYDNGEVDGDSVSLFYNGKLILSHKKLSEKPISVTLDASTGNDINQLTMYAENLGEIAPNTALMIVRDGEKRYEVRISSDFKNSGTIHFVHHPKTQ